MVKIVCSVLFFPWQQMNDFRLHSKHHLLSADLLTQWCRAEIISFRVDVDTRSEQGFCCPHLVCHDTFMTAAWSQCTLGAPALMDDSSALCCHCFKDHFSTAPQTGAVWTGELGRRAGHNGWMKLCVWWKDCWSQQRVRESSGGIVLPRRQSVQFLWTQWEAVDVFDWYVFL